jgi:hypothetical protein
LGDFPTHHFYKNAEILFPYRSFYPSTEESKKVNGKKPKKHSETINWKQKKVPGKGTKKLQGLKI